MIHQCISKVANLNFPELYHDFKRFMLSTDNDKSEFGLFSTLKRSHGIMLILHSIVMMEDYENAELITYLLSRIISSSHEIERYQKFE